MFGFILRRLLQTVPVLFVVATATFFMVRLAPGGPFSDEKSVSPEVLANLERHYGMDKPLWRQYADYLWRAARGDLGPSFAYSNRAVNEIIAAKFPVSAALGGAAMAFAIVLGISAGVLASTRPNRARDYGAMSLATVGLCVPAFVLGPAMVWLFCLKFGWFNPIGWETVGDMVLPTIALGAMYAANIARLTRAGMLDTLSMDFVRVARAKGAPEWRVVISHALRGGVTPVIAYLGPATAGILTGSFVIETIFQIPGLGREFVGAAFNRDYGLIMGTVLFYAALICLFNAAADILQVALDPRRSFKEAP